MYWLYLSISAVEAVDNKFYLSKIKVVDEVFFFIINRRYKLHLSYFDVSYIYQKFFDTRSTGVNFLSFFITEVLHE